jgi:ATP-binding cassette subfamily F protein 3
VVFPIPLAGARGSENILRGKIGLADLLMIQLSGAGKRYGHKLLFDGLDWLVTPKDRAGIVGANGTGKSTLLKILAGIETLDYGSMNAMKGITAGYLPQDGLTLSGRSVFAECMSVFDDLRDMEQELEVLAHRMGELDPASGDYAAVADRFQRLDSEFRTRDGYAIEAQVGIILNGLGFPKDDWSRIWTWRLGTGSKTT